MTRQQATEVLQQILSKVEEDIIGQRSIVEAVAYGFLAGGHVLMSGVPGLGKTRLVRVFARHLGLSFGRIQYTPDLLPSDITGSEILQGSNEEGKRSFEFIRGPIFHHLILADEINRASPRTQAAMLEAMEERAVTYSGVRYPLPHPFMVCATQNPLEFEGTYPLPEAQLDRFLLYIVVNYPEEHHELDILKYHHPHAETKPKEKSPEETKPEKTREDHMEEAGAQDHASQETSTPASPWDQNTILELRDHTQRTAVSAEILQLVNALTRSTRQPLEATEQIKQDKGKGAVDTSRYGLRFGAGPRGGLALLAAAKACALSCGDEEVRWRHVCQVALPVLRHRISLAPSYSKQWGGQDGYIGALLHQLARRHRLSSPQ